MKLLINILTSLKQKRELLQLKLVFSYKVYEQGLYKVYYITLNDRQILGPHFSEQEVNKTISDLKSGN